MLIGYAAYLIRERRIDPTVSPHDLVADAYLKVGTLNIVDLKKSILCLIYDERSRSSAHVPFEVSEFSKKTVNQTSAVIETSRTCTHCGEEKGLDGFRKMKNRYGLEYYRNACRDCENANLRNERKAKGCKARPPYRDKSLIYSSQVCTCCGVEKEFSAYLKRVSKSGRVYYAGRCNSCKHKKHRENLKQNPERLAVYRARMREKNRKYRQTSNGCERVKEGQERWRIKSAYLTKAKSEQKKQADLLKYALLMEQRQAKRAKGRGYCQSNSMRAMQTLRTGQRTCAGCHQNYDTSEFGRRINTKTGVEYFQPYCKSCRVKNNKESRLVRSILNTNPNFDWKAYLVNHRQQAGLRVCTCCKEELSLDLFHRKTDPKTGLQRPHTYCKACVSERVG